MQIEVITQSGIGNTPRRCVGDVLNAVSARPDCQRFRFAVAYMRVSGLKLLYGTLQSLCTRRGHIAGAVGIDQGITTHEALELLCQLSSDSTIVCTVSHYLYHPKLYLVEGAQWAYAVVGSANLTRDGLYRNIELATLIHLDLAFSADIDIYTTFDAFLSELLNPANPNVQPLNATTLKHLAGMALISDESHVPEPRFMREHKEVAASFKALFPPLPVRSVPTVRDVVAISAYSRETPAMAVSNASQPRSSAHPSPSADEPLSDLSIPPLPMGRPEARLAELPESSVEAVSAFVEHHPLTIEPERRIHRKLYKTSCEVCNNVAKCVAIVDKASENPPGRVHFICHGCHKHYFASMDDSEKISLLEKANTTAKRFKFPLTIAMNVVLGRETLSTARAKVRSRRHRENEQSKKRARSQRWRPVYGPGRSG